MDGSRSSYKTIVTESFGDALSGTGQGKRKAKAALKNEGRRNFITTINNVRRRLQTPPWERDTERKLVGPYPFRDPKRIWSISEILIIDRDESTEVSYLFFFFLRTLSFRLSFK